MPYLVRRLARKDLLPAIVFIFSRVGCDEAAEAVAGGTREDLLLTSMEAAMVREQVAAFRAEHPELPMAEVPRVDGTQ